MDPMYKKEDDLSYHPLNSQKMWLLAKLLFFKKQKSLCKDIGKHTQFFEYVTLVFTQAYMADYRLLKLYLTIMHLHFLAWLALVYIQELVQFYCIAATIHPIL